MAKLARLVSVHKDGNTTVRAYKRAARGRLSVAGVCELEGRPAREVFQDPNVAADLLLPQQRNSKAQR